MGDTEFKLSLANVLLTIKDLQSEGKHSPFTTYVKHYDKQCITCFWKIISKSEDHFAKTIIIPISQREHQGTKNLKSYPGRMYQSWI